MTVTINNKLNGAPTGAGSGETPTGGAQPGEVRTFLVGQVPSGWQQIAGPASELAPAGEFGVFVAVGFAGATGSEEHGQRLYSTSAGRLFVVTAGANLFEVSSSFSQLSPPTYVPNLLDGGGALFVALPAGNLLRIGGHLTWQSPESGATQLFNADTQSFTALATKPTPNASSFSCAAVAGDGLLYGVFGSAGSVDSFNPSTNAWTENVATVDVPGDFYRAAVKLPSGKLLFVLDSAVYVFDPATKQFTSVGEAANAAAVIATPAGARVYSVGVEYSNDLSGVVFREFVEASGDLVFCNPGQAAEWFANGVQAVLNAQTGGVVLKATNEMPGRDVALQHYMAYTPFGTVQAAKL